MAGSIIKVLSRCNKYSVHIRNDKSTALLQFGNRSISGNFGARPTDEDLIKLTGDDPDKKEIGSKAMRAYLERAKQHDIFMKQQLAEYNIGKRHLANMMGEDPETYTQKDIDKAIEYLFPSGLFEPKARPLMKPPEEVFPQRKAAEFDESGRPHHFLFYTGRPNLYKLLYDIADHLESLNEYEDKMSRKSIPPDASKKIDLIGSEWLTQIELETMLVETIIEKEYKSFIASMERLVEHTYSYRLKEFIDKYRKTLMRQSKAYDIPKPNEEADGSRYITTKECLRKSARGVVTVRSPGTGLISINGKGIEYFEDTQPREQSLVFKNFLASLRQHNKVLEVQWISSHYCRILGNEKADFLAKQAAKAAPPPAVAMSFGSAKNKIKIGTKKIFQSSKEEAAQLKSWWTEIKKCWTKVGRERQPLPNSGLQPATTSCSTT